MVTVEALKEMFEAVFQQELDMTNLNESSDLKKDLGMTSISFLYMAMVLEEKYSIKFANEDFTKIETISDVIALVESKVHG